MVREHHLSQMDLIELSSNMDPTKAIITTTMNGECFSIQSLEIGNADGRDGFLHYFRIRDVRKERGTRNVSLFVSGLLKQLFRISINS